MAAFEQIESKIRALRQGRAQAHGRAFEPLIKWWLQNDPAWSSLLEEVWLWKEWPDRWKEQEAGIDHVARDAKGEMWAVQVKMWRRDTKVTKQAIQSFVSESEGFDRRLLITTSWNLSFHARDLCERLGIVVVARENLLKSTVEWSAAGPVVLAHLQKTLARKARRRQESDHRDRRRQDRRDRRARRDEARDEWQDIEGTPHSQRLLGKRLREARKKRGLTQLELAGEAHVSVPTLRFLEFGKGNLSSWQKVLSALSLAVEGSNLPPGETIGQRVVRLRKRRRISQRKLASLAQSTQPTIIALEKRNQGRLDLLEKVLIVLGADHYLA